MDNTQRASYEGFMGTPAAKGLGLLLGFAVAFGMVCAGLYRNTCLFVFVGVLLFVIPKLFGVKRFSTLAVLGVAFLLITPVVGALCFSAPTIDDDKISDITGEFHDASVVRDGDTYDITVVFDGTPTGDVKVFTPTLGTVSFNVEIYPMNTDGYVMTNTSGNTYVFNDLALESGKVYKIYFESGDVRSGSATVDANITDGDITKHALIWNFYVVGMAAIVFFLVLVLTTYMRRSLEKTRARMEAEGRLYPQGYGRCKECGMLVLPGEVTCRKCGAYIEIPEEIKAKMKRKVEYTECSECGAEVPSDARKCPKCGASFDEATEEVKIEATPEIIEAHQESKEPSDEYFECSECGAKVPADANVCPQCGAKFDEE